MMTALVNFQCGHIDQILLKINQKILCKMLIIFFIISKFLIDKNEI